MKITYVENLGVYFIKAKTTQALGIDMIDKNSRNLLLKEVLARANKEEKIEHGKIAKKRSVLVKLVSELLLKWHDLFERDKRNEYSKDTGGKCNKSVVEMTTDEFDEYMEQTRRQREGFFKWANETIAVATEGVDLLHKLLESEVELKNLCFDEKWLLLSIALKSHPSLLKYLE